MILGWRGFWAGMVAASAVAAAGCGGGGGGGGGGSSQAATRTMFIDNFATGGTSAFVTLGTVTTTSSVGNPAPALVVDDTGSTTSEAVSVTLFAVANGITITWDEDMAAGTSQSGLSSNTGANGPSADPLLAGFEYGVPTVSSSNGQPAMILNGTSLGSTSLAGPISGWNTYQISIAADGIVTYSVNGTVQGVSSSPINGTGSYPIEFQAYTQNFANGPDYVDNIRITIP